MELTRKFVSVSSEFPGVRTRELLEKRKTYVPNGIGNNTPIFVQRAEGALIYDPDGNVFLDFAGAIGTLNVGHCPPEVVEAVQMQAGKYIHTCFHVAMYEPYVTLAEKLSQITPGQFPKKTMFLNSGAEAVENAVKIARKYTGKSGIVSFTRGFHGRTLLGMSLTSKVKPYKYKMGPFAPSIYKAQYPYPLYRPDGMSEKEYASYCVRQFEDFLLTEAAPEELAAVIMEPVQGEGGFIVPPIAFVKGIYDICKKNGILFIADEIQTGFGRTGTMFASEHFDIEPDLITMSKSIAAGMPISAVTGRAEVMDAPSPGEIGGTYGGSPLGCAAALAVIEKIEREQLVERSRQIGQTIHRYFIGLQQRVPLVAEVRGLGAMFAVEFIDPETKQPAKEFVAALQKECYEAGVILLTAGMYGNVIRFLTPLVITDEQLAEGLDIIGKLIQQRYSLLRK
ncbi:4-aminobutyrate--2-oxoglutarate transaminase [Paenibacillus alginolyticus]|uniref:(S)-3-amino-2-methylpropionate transaminase n=1 Tax=Paenibacillus alginolyticus TaxID=59839 RepID=A0ABT4GAL3_9BACL|nr:4-aminobutyrate--2-oxoglutarate transaminase [Paenibacillus alginolyticus]MCY9693223.1 4-aminobutyrate--2-oxoglutarate transaminase [Paenibacillus alginolyticus]MEC0146008.1 4-aminobutyrate--2-oxoglutarate transaminase [Paenibacillus alginolyticus]